MGLTICNGYSSAVTVTIGYANRDHCANAGGWIKEGWWNIAPGQCVRVYGGSLKNLNRYWTYYARTYDGAVIWAGNYCTTVVNKAFYQCWNNPSDYQVCYRLFDINSYDNYTLTLTG
jgi:uncharacterized membrane protein